jgi:hypothetical protein
MIPISLLPDASPDVTNSTDPGVRFSKKSPPKENSRDKDAAFAIRLGTRFA